MPPLGTRGRLEASELPSDPTLPGLTLLGHPVQLVETLSRPLTHWLGPDSRLIDSRAHVRRLSPGKRCSVELELVVDRDSGRPPERRRFLGKVYRDDRAAVLYDTLGHLRPHVVGA